MGIGSLVGAFIVGGAIGFALGIIFGRGVRRDFQKTVDDIKKEIQGISRRI